MKEADIKILLPEPNFEDEGEESAEEAAPADAE